MNDRATFPAIFDEVILGSVVVSTNQCSCLCGRIGIVIEDSFYCCVIRYSSPIKCPGQNRWQQEWSLPKRELIEVTEDFSI